MTTNSQAGPDRAAAADRSASTWRAGRFRPHPATSRWALAAALLALPVMAIVATLLVRSAPVEMVLGSRRGSVLIGVQLLVVAAVGAVVVVRRPRNILGRIISVGAVIGCSWLFLDAYAVHGLVDGASPLPGAPAAAWAANWWWIGMWGLVAPLVILLFPDGRLPATGWLRVYTGFVVLVAGTAMVALASSPGPLVFYPFQPNPLAVGGTLGDVIREATPVLGGLTRLLTAFALMTLFLRMRRGPDATRHQIKWVAYAAVMAGVFLLAVVVTARTSRLLWLEDATHLSGALPAVAAGVAILRYRLYDIDRVVSRTVSYGILTVLLAGVYAGGVLVLGPVLATLGGGSQLAVAAATLLVAAVFRPAKTRIRIAVDRRFNRDRYDAQRTVDAFVVRLRDEVSLEQVPAELIDAVHATVQPAGAYLWLRRPSGEPTA